MKEVAYITSGKVGLHRFTYNELIELEKLGQKFVLCLTQLNLGPWMPESRWTVVVASKSSAISAFVKSVICNPRKIIGLYNHARDRQVKKYFLIALGLYTSLIKHSITSLHCQMGDKKLYIGYYLKILLGVPLSVTVHAHELYQRQVYDQPEKIHELFNACDQVLTISDFNADLIHKTFLVPEDRITVMRLFADIDYQHKVIDKTKFLIVANWAEKKGFKILIDAVQKIKRDDFVVWVVGGTYFSDNSIDVAQLIKNVGLDSRFAILGRIGGVTLDIVFSACDVFCLPSCTELYADGKPAEREGIPVALMEAMAWGKPIISTRHAGIPELVDEILVEEKNVEELRSAMEYMLENRDEWADMGKRNQAKLKEKFSRDNVKLLAETFHKWQE